MRNEVVAALLVVAILASTGVGYLIGSSKSQTTTITVTATPNETAPLSRSNGDWAFSISLVSAGQEFALSYNLTNISGQPQTVDIANPLINPTLYSANGSVVWAWNPSVMNYIATIPSKAGNWSAPLDIPTSALSAGQKYVLSVHPLIWVPNTSGSGAFTIGESLMINTTISVT